MPMLLPSFLIKNLKKNKKEFEFLEKFLLFLTNLGGRYKIKTAEILAVFIFSVFFVLLKSRKKVEIENCIFY